MTNIDYTHRILKSELARSERDGVAVAALCGEVDYWGDDSGDRRSSEPTGAADPHCPMCDALQQFRDERPASASFIENVKEFATDDPDNSLAIGAQFHVDDDGTEHRQILIGSLGVDVSDLPALIEALTKAASLLDRKEAHR